MIRRCHQRLDALCDAQTPESDGEESIPGEQSEERDVEILRSLPVPAGSDGWWSCAAPVTRGCAMLRTGTLYDPLSAAAHLSVPRHRQSSDRELQGFRPISAPGVVAELTLVREWIVPTAVGAVEPLG